MFRRQRHLTDVELLTLVDDAVQAQPARRLLDHVSTCAACEARRAALSRTLLSSVAAIREDAGGRTDAWADSRARLERRLSSELLATPRSGLPPATARRFLVGTAAVAAAAIVTLVVTAHELRSRPSPHQGASLASIDNGALPKGSLTPGATEPLTADQLCRGEHAGVTQVDPAVRQQVLAAYGMPDVPPQEYELDYLITPALGGANDPRNLWPERYSDRTWNAKVKDQLEELLPPLVCQGQVDLKTAQEDIARNWVEAYKKYFKTNTPLRTGA